MSSVDAHGMRASRKKVHVRHESVCVRNGRRVEMYQLDVEGGGKGEVYKGTG